MAAVTSSLPLTKHFLPYNNCVFTTSSSSVVKSTRSISISISISLHQKKKKKKEGTISASKSFNDLFGPSKSDKGGGGAAVLERPKFDQSQFEPSTQVQEGGDIGRVRDRRGPGSGDSYRVLLIDDKRHTENLVVKALPQAVPAVTPDGARKLFDLSRQNGLAVVIVTVKEHAEFYSQMMVRGGLRSTIEPDSTLL